MKTNLIRVLVLSALAATAAFAQPAEAARTQAQRGSAPAPIVGIWDVAVTVVNCQTGASIRNVHSVQMYQPDGAFSETTSIGTRGSSLGYWYNQELQRYGANYFFFRYNADGSFASIAKAINTITLSSDGNSFMVAATIQDYDANNTLISTGCVTQTAKRL